MGMKVYAAETPNQAVDAIVPLIKNRFGSSDSIRQNAIEPLTSNQTNLFTLDGSKQGSGQLICPASPYFLNVSIQSGPSGDLSQVLIQQDTDFDSKIDYSYSVPMLISGICSNGIISCNQGSWDSCAAHKWVATGGKVTLSSVHPNALGGCYCINNSCGEDIVGSALPRVLGDIGGGIVASIQANNPRYAITDTQIKNTTISYYGQNSVDCSKTAFSSGQGSNVEQYYQSPHSMESAGVQAFYSKDHSTSPRALGLSELLQDHSVTSKTCSKERLVSVASSVTFCSAPALVGAHSKETTKFYRVMAGRGSGKNDCECKKVGGTSLCSPPLFETVPSAPEGAVYLGRSAEDFFDRKKRRGADECSFYLYDYYSVCQRMTDTVTETFSDACQSIKANRECKLKEEVIDGVKTISNFNPTGIRSVRSCREYQGIVTNFSVCHDDWKTQETFFCEEKQRSDLSGITARAQRVTSSTVATHSGSNFQYKDTVKDDKGGLITESHTVGLPEFSPQPTCEMACKTSRLTTRTDVTETGNLSQNLVSTQSHNFYYKACSTSGQCPLESGETLVKKCQCVNEFPDALGYMMVLKEASQGMICSSGTKK